MSEQPTRREEAGRAEGSGQDDCYLMSGLTISSARELPELPRARAGVPDVRVSWQPSAPLSAHADYRPDLFEGQTEDEFLALSRGEDSSVLWVEDLCRFEVSGGGRLIACAPTPKADAPSIRHLLLDHVLPRAIASAGDVVLHASAVEVGGRAVAFVGATGEGKSTLAAAFAQAGHELLSDDCLRLTLTGKRILAHAAYPGLRLWPGHAPRVVDDSYASFPVAAYTEKERFAQAPGERASPGPLPLARWYVLSSAPDGDERVVIARRSRLAALVAATDFAFHLDHGRAEDHAAGLQALSASPILSLARDLAFPREIDRLAEVVAAVREDVAGA